MAVCVVITLWDRARGGAWNARSQQEGGVVEILSALLFLSAALAGFINAAGARTARDRAIGLFIGTAGAIGFLDEISFGQSIFGLTIVHGVSLDAVHDLFLLSYRVLRDWFASMQILFAALVCLALVAGLAFVYRWQLIEWFRAVPETGFIVAAVGLVVIALVIDLEVFTPSGPLGFTYDLEEIFEMSGGVALCCAAFVQRF